MIVINELLLGNPDVTAWMPTVCVSCCCAFTGLRACRAALRSDHATNCTVANTHAGRPLRVHACTPLYAALVFFKKNSEVSFRRGCGTVQLMIRC